MKKAIIHGCYNTTNFGDLLLLEILAKYLKEKWNIETETLRLPNTIKLEHCKVVKNYWNAISPTYAIFGGGGYLEDDNGSKIATKVLLRYLIPAKIWASFNIPFAIIGPGSGPITGSKGSKRIKWICEHASHISIRDELSTSIIRRLGVKRADLKTTADLALTINDKDIPAIYKYNLKEALGNSSNKKKIIGIHLERLYTNDLLFDKFFELPFLADKIFLEKFHLVFFFDYESININKLENRLKLFSNLSYSIIPRMNHWSTADFLRQCDAVLTTKLHVSIVSANFGVPIFGFSAHEKTARFYSEIGRQNYQRMWNNDIGCINDWMIELKDDYSNAWVLNSELLSNIKKKALENFSILDNYISGINSKHALKSSI